MVKCSQDTAHVLLGVVVAVVCGALISVNAVNSTTFEKLELAMESYFAGLCVPEVTEVELKWGVSPRILCFLLCTQRSNCTFFTSTGSNCKLWGLTLDEGYHLGNFSPPLTPSYWPKVRIPPPPIDVALGKNGSSETVFMNFQYGTMLTYGSMCFPKPSDCTATNNIKNWAKVDLEQPWPVTRIVLTAPGGPARPYFVDITIRAGSYGNVSDPYVGKTSSTAPAVNNAKVEFPVPATVPPFRFISLKNEKTAKEICLCKVQAFL